MTAALVVLVLLPSCGHHARQKPGIAPPLGRQGVKGDLHYDGKPLEAAYVFVYRNTSTNLLGPADFASDPSSADGSYHIDLVEGVYYLVARKWASGGSGGPMTSGDLYSIYPGNPVRIEPGRYATVDLDLARLRDPMFFRFRPHGAASTGIRGTLTDEEGRPMAWAFALAYTTDNMRKIPDYTSAMTAADGKFVIRLPSGGRYWLAARTNLRGRPAPREPYGLYLGSPDHSVEVADGSFLEGITLQLRRYRPGAEPAVP